MSVSDDKFNALRTQGYTGSTSDMWLQFLLANGAMTKNTTDAFKEFLMTKGFSGQVNDQWYKYLGSLGYTGALPDRVAQFWAAGGVIVPPPAPNSLWVDSKAWVDPQVWVD